MQAIILAAGMGKRLKELTSNNTKCMVELNGVTLIERILKQLDDINLSKIIIVIGYEGEKLKTYINSLKIKTSIIYVTNTIYYKTNNIYSLFLAKDYLLKEDTLLLESDLIIEASILQKIIKDPYPNLALVDKYESWMDGTVITLDKENNIENFLSKAQFKYKDVKSYYKTVNIYKFSKAFSNSRYVPFLEAYSKALGKNEFYEQVLKVITLLEKPEIKVTILNGEKWYEIDDIQDLDIAESIFANSEDEKLKKIQDREGGYWRYPKIIDFQNPTPILTSRKLLKEIKANFSNLISSSSSNNKINSLLVAKYFDLDQKNTLVFNSTNQILATLFKHFSGNIAITLATAKIYNLEIPSERIIAFDTALKDYKYGANELISFFDDKEISFLLIMNPENPTGNFITQNGIINIIQWAHQKEIVVIIDESFIDYVSKSEAESLLVKNILEKYPNLIIIKNISAPQGLSGLRISLLTCHNHKIILPLEKATANCKLNSFEEFYLQIFEKYKTDYFQAIINFKKIQNRYFKMLSTINNIRIISSQTNFFLCKLKGNVSAAELARRLLNEYNILICDLSKTKGFNGEYIKLSIKDKRNNKKLIDAMKTIID